MNYYYPSYLPLELLLPMQVGQRQPQNTPQGYTSLATPGHPHNGPHAQTRYTSRASPNLARYSDDEYMQAYGRRTCPSSGAPYTTGNSVHHNHPGRTSPSSTPYVTENSAYKSQTSPSGAPYTAENCVQHLPTSRRSPEPTLSASTVSVHNNPNYTSQQARYEREPCMHRQIFSPPLRGEGERNAEDAEMGGLSSGGDGGGGMTREAPRLWGSEELEGSFLRGTAVGKRIDEVFDY